MKNYENFINTWGSGKNNHFDGEYIYNEKDDYKYIGFNLFDFEDIYYESVEIDKSYRKIHIIRNYKKYV